jgi:DNA-binding NtrC family response regulator
MNRVLLIEDEQMICDVITDCFGEQFVTEVVCARSGMLGARMIAGSRFDLAIIDVGLPQLSGLELAIHAVNENIPVLLISGHPGVTEKLARFGYPYLEKPFALDALHAEALRVISESRENIQRVKSSAEKMQAGAEALSAALNEARRLLAEINTQRKMRGLAADPAPGASTGGGRPMERRPNAAAPERSGPERSGDNI